MLNPPAKYLPRWTFEISCFMYNSRPQEINKEELEGNSMRCGRKLAKDGEVSMGCNSIV